MVADKHNLNEADVHIGTKSKPRVNPSILKSSPITETNVPGTQAEVNPGT